MAKHTGFDGEVRYYAPRDVWFGFMGGKVVVTKKTQRACLNFLAAGSYAKKEEQSEIKQQLIQQTADAYHKAMKLFPRCNIAMPSASFFNRGKCAGRAYYAKNHVEFNVALAETNKERFNDTVLHEVAHLVTNNLYPHASTHGPEFKHILITMGGSGSRCHNYDVSVVTRPSKKYVYTCGCAGRTHTVGSGYHSRMRKGHVYNCRLCKTTLSFTGALI